MALRYRLYWLLFRSFAVLPEGLRYAVADGLWLLFYRLLGYRRRVVRENLAAAFPEKTAEERRRIESRFYRNLCDMLVETLALGGARVKAVARNWTVDYAAFDRQIDETGQGLILLVSHQFNWEAGSWILAPHLRAPQVVVYTSISDRAFERAFLEVRQANGQAFVSEKEMVRLFRLMKAQPSVVLLAADQSPFSLSKARWQEFFHRPTPFHQGIEEVARRSGGRVAFLELVRHGRGRYQAVAHPWPEDPRTAPPGALTAAYVRFIEEAIRRQPDNYLWTHRRWKHSHRWAEFAAEG